MCGFKSAHVKQSEKCLYHYCPSCGMTGPHAIKDEQKEIMRRAMRPENGGIPTPNTTPMPTLGSEAMPTPTHTQEIEANTETQNAPKRRGLFS